MAFLEIKNVRIAGISAGVPAEVEENATLSLFSSQEEAKKFMASTGIERRHIAGNLTTSDLCLAAAEKLIADLQWDKEEIDALIFLSQGPDYLLPATSCILQDKLKLNKECYTLDISLGCSGWVYGLSVAASLLSNGMMKKALFLCGDTSQGTSPEDKSTWPLFGEAGTVTALEFDETANNLQFHFGTDGSGYEAIIIPHGCSRRPITVDSLEMEEIAPGIKRSKKHTILNGMDVFAFGISTVPETITKLSNKFEIDLKKVDYFIFHQANLYMNELIRKSLELPQEKVPYSLKNFGNTSSASIPLTIVTELSEQARLEKHSYIGCGFGVGLSWGTIAFELNNITLPELVIVK